MLPNSVFRRWQHSFEEDAGDVQVYRPEEYPFPPARGRAGIEFRPDGSLVRWAIGRGDAPEAQPGRWQDAGPATIAVTEGQETGSVLDVVECSEDVLKVRWRGPG